MKKKEETALAVLKPKALPVPAVVPKPSKADIINAAVARARQKYDERAEKIAQQNEEIDARIVAEGLRLLSENMGLYEAKLCRFYSKAESANLEFTIGGPTIKKLIKEKDKIENCGWFNEDQERAKIKDALDGSQDRVALILSREENVKLLDDLLQKINSKKEK
jgi:hypothetical protein